MNCFALHVSHASTSGGGSRAHNLDLATRKEVLCSMHKIGFAFDRAAFYSSLGIAITVSRGGGAQVLTHAWSRPTSTFEAL